MVQYTAAMVLSVAVLCSMALLSQASPVDWWKSEFAREEEKEILEEVAAHIISELESEMMIQQDEGVPLCPIPSLPTGEGYAKGNITLKYGHRQPGDVANYSCEKGSRRKGPERRTCNEDGKWSGNDPMCIDSLCGNDNYVFYSRTGANVVVDPSNLKVTFTCQDNFSLFLTFDDLDVIVDPDYKRAQIDSLEYDFPYCTSRNKNGFPQCFLLCPMLKNITNGEVSYRFQGDHRIGDIATYSCINDDDYELTNPKKKRCYSVDQEDYAEWTPDGIPECIPLCPILSNILNGKVSNTSRRLNHGIATYSCINKNYILNETTPRQCIQENPGDKPMWSGNEPQCILLQCPELPRTIVNGYVHYTDRRLGAVATYLCNDGPGEYVIDGSETRTCTKDAESDGKRATWSPGDEPKCIPLCPMLEDNIVNGYLDNPTNRRPGAEAIYSCNTGPGEYVLEGSPRTCTKVAGGSRATWSPGDEPQCIPLCPMLEDKIVNGYLDNPTNRRPGAEATYSCNSGPGEYVLEGSPRTCTKVAGGSRAIWLPGDEPECIPLCPELPNTIGNVTVNRPTNRTPGAMANYSCLKDIPGEHEFEGPETKTCTKDEDGKRATWQPSDDPKCVSLCPIPRLRTGEGYAKGVVTYRNRKPGDIATYTCEEGSRRKGPENRTCGEDAKWSGEDPFCEYIICPLVNLPITNGEFSPSNGPIKGPGGSQGYGVGTMVYYRCTSDRFELRGESIITCLESGEWDHEPPKCVEIPICPLDDLPITNGEFSPSNGPITGPGGSLGYAVGTVVNYRCVSDRFELRGESSIICLESGEWSHPPPECFAVRCPKLRLSGNPRSVDKTRQQILRDRPRDYQRLLIETFFKKNIKGNLVPYDEGSTAKLTCIRIDHNGWTLMPNSPSVQTCVRNSTNGDLYWTKPGICVYRYSITRPALTGGTG